MLNELKLYGIIGEAVTSQAVRLQLARMDQTQPLLVRIDSDGGSVVEGMRIRDCIAQYPGPKKAIVEPTAFSIASYIVTAFDDVEIVDNGYMMIHRPRMDALEANADQLGANAEMVAKFDQTLTSDYARKMGLPESRVREMMEATTYLNAEEAVQMGLATSIARRVITPRSVLSNLLPHKVYAALLSAGQSGKSSEPTQEPKAMSNTVTAASIKDIRAAFPKAKDSFVLKCLDQGMTMPEVQTAAQDEIATENDMLRTECEALKTKCQQLEAQLATLNPDLPATDPTMIPEAKATPAAPALAARARASAVKNVAASGTALSARAQWDNAISQAKAEGMNHMAAVRSVGRRFPDLQAQVVAEANAARMN